MSWSLFGKKSALGKSGDAPVSQRIVMITGGARGIGFGIATCFVQKGATVVIADVDGSAAIEAAAKLNTINSTGSFGIACDVTCRDQVESSVKQTVSRFGQIDVLVNNAGTCPFVEALQLAPEIFNKTIDVNLNGG